MSRIAKLTLSISCFLPLFFILGAENLYAAYCLYLPAENTTLFRSLLKQSTDFLFNAGMFVAWLLLFLIGIVGIIGFRKNFLNAEKLSKETVILTKADNVTAEY